jgi:hypothetical protein
MANKFKVRQRVRLSQSGYMNSRTGSGSYEVVRLMPADQTGEPSYRIKSGLNERAVRESEITEI